MPVYNNQFSQWPLAALALSPVLTLRAGVQLTTIDYVKRISVKGLLLKRYGVTELLIMPK